MFRFSFSKALIVFAVLAMSYCSMASAGVVSPSDPKPRLYLTTADVTRLRQQAKLPEMATAFSDLQNRTELSQNAWLKKYPATAAPRSTAELIAIGKSDHPVSDFKTIATAYSLHPSFELGRLLREKLVAAIGVRQIHNYWQNDGIHEGETAMQFLEGYDIASSAGLLTAEDERAIKEEMRRCGHFLQGWGLDSWLPDNGFSQGYTEYYRTVYCLNFHMFATSMVGTIAMVYPDLPEAEEWLRTAQSELPKLFFSDFGLDGGYGEGSLHYWHPTFRALLQYMVASRNLGVRDYFSDPAMTDAMRRTLTWRMNLTEPDGRGFAVGDSSHDTVGAEYLIEAGKILGQPEFVWTGRSIIERARPGMVPDEPYDLFFYDQSAQASAPQALFSNHPYSGYGVFRSGWTARDNSLILKYGTTYIGRRENETNLVISGHAHADALEFDMYFKGLPITVDTAWGHYSDWNIYGGYTKATVAHNTVGLGNQWGYSRLDGLYAEHVKQHGKEFLYETSQNNISRSTTELRAFGDVGQMGIFSACLKTYDQVTQQRTVVWFRETGVAVVNDQMESDREQPYEWYLNPIGKLLSQNNTLTFGDGISKLDVVPVLPQGETVQIVDKGDPRVPPYYVGLRPDAETKDSRKSRWEHVTLLVLKKDATSADFLNVLVPYEKDAPFTSAPMGSKGVKLTGQNSTLLVASGGNDDSSLVVDGSFGVARLDKGALTSYALHHGHVLGLGNDDLIRVELMSKAWEPLFDSAVTAAVSIADHRASFSFPFSPLDRRVVLFSPKVNEGQEKALPISVSVSFKVNEKPKRIVALRSSTQMPKLDDPAFDKRTVAWENDPHKGHYMREPLDFVWNEEKKTVTMTLDVGIRQVVWE